jgi:hypothetical protein
MKIKQTWLYKELQKFQDGPILSIDEFTKIGENSGTLLSIINIIIIPIIFLGAIIFIPSLLILSLPFYIVKDFYDWYIRANYEKLKLKKELKELRKKTDVLNNVELALNKYGDSLVKKEGLYNLSMYNHDITLYGFLLKFFKEYNDIYNTVNKNNKVICDTGRRRSLDDIYLICKYYFPDCTTYQVFKELIKLSKSNKINYSKCSTINKYVFYHNPYTYAENSSNSYVEYFNCKITFNELLKNLK